MINKICVYDDRVEFTTGKNFEPGKISGSKIGGILGLYYGHFNAMTEVLGCNPFVGNIPTKVGVFEEPRIFNYWNSLNNDDYFKFEMDRKIIPTIFPITSIYGEFDGLCLKPNVMDLLEIKTCNRFSGIYKTYVSKHKIPEHHRLQVLLYVLAVYLSWGIILKSYTFLYYVVDNMHYDACKQDKMEELEFFPKRLTKFKHTLTEEDWEYILAKKEEAINIIESCKVSKNKWVVKYDKTNDKDTNCLKNVYEWATTNKINIEMKG